MMQMSREATEQEVRGLLDTEPGQLQVGWAERAIDAATQSRFWVNEDSGQIVGLGILSYLDAPHADPSGWWISYVWTHPDYREDHYAWEMAEAGIDTLAGEGHSFSRKNCPCEGMCTPYVASLDRSDPDLPYGPGTGGYQATGRPFYLLGHSHLRGFVLYTVNEVDPDWRDS